MRVAAAQFSVSHDLEKNFQAMADLIQKAVKQKAKLVQFPEMSLTGYHPACPSKRVETRWGAIRQYRVRMQALARKHQVALVYGFPRVNPEGLPWNSLEVVDASGETLGCYDKRKLYGKESEYYSPGERDLIVTLDGVSCGFLICYENCFPELYAEYKKQGAELIVHSFYNAGQSEPTTIAELMRASLIVRAADHGLCVMASNSSKSLSPMPATIVYPDGMAFRAKTKQAELVYAEVPPTKLGWTYST